MASPAPAPAPTPKALFVPAALAVALFTLPPLLSYFGIVPAFAAFLAWIFALVPAVIAMLVGAHAATKGHGKAGMLSLAIGLVPIGVIGYGAVEGRKYPPVNDIATNLDNPPQFVAALNAPENKGKDLVYPDEYRSPIVAVYPDLISLQLAVPAQEAFDQVRAAAEATPHWRIVRVDPEALTLEGEETSGIFQFTDDFVIRVLPMDGTSQVDMRSRSRVGQADFGVNARRIRSFFAALGARTGGTGAADASEPAAP